ncbi:MAG: class I SAM-dependent methyltransferase [Lewinellaceae bacterium]|nr:class I SAM-dependent methyltransferase [Saprospiraceae bacterium]MCB9340977.1 class I SAM-dependent methyltransferase [Lewinellaceae bacterium]
MPDGSVIYAVDKVREIRQASGSRLEIRFLKADFEKERLPLPPLDGILMANLLHYVFDKKSLLQKLRGNLKPGGRSEGRHTEAFWQQEFETCYRWFLN